MTASAPTASVRVVVAGGGTAGHIEPALAVADAVRAADPQAIVTAVGTARGLEGRLVPARGYELDLIDPVPVPRKPSGDLLRLPLRVRKAVAQAVDVLRARQASVLVGFGGYVSAPMCLAARRLRIPIVVHEANARAGMANRLGARFAARVLVANPGARLGDRAEVVGIPLRPQIAELDRAAVRAEARAAFGLPAQGPVLLVTGGSQGAQRINDAASGAAQALSSAGIAVLHAYGPKNQLDLPDSLPGAPYVAVPYLDRMDLAYAAADVALCRAGAMTVAELAAVGLVGVYVPLPHGNGEQALNAEPVVAAGGGLLVADEDCTPAYVGSEVKELCADPERLALLGEFAAGMGHRHAAASIAAVVLDAAAAAPSRKGTR